ncbi:hypothetical protein [Streptomyces sp. NPDC001594]|uniref:hypothetical protein n=1 Tax=Streptomyces sp. NPDC001594 TaxID=3364590 RepID=UPI0036C747E1
MNDAARATGPMLPPTDPPKSPPPQKEPVEAVGPRQPATRPAGGVELPRPRMVIRNRPTRALVFRSDQWAPAKAAAAAVETVRGWGYTRISTDDLTACVRVLAWAAVGAGGRRLSLHLADQEQRILVLVLGHAPADTGEDVLRVLGALRSVAACGTDTDEEDGPRLWALLEAEPRRGPVVTSPRPGPRRPLR